MDKYFKLFIEEGKNLLDVWETSCIELLEEFSFESANSVYRVAHSLKGASKMSGLKRFPEFIHEIEDILTNVKNQRYKEPEEIFFFLLECQKFLVEWLENLNDSENEEVTKDFEEFKMKVEEIKDIDLIDLKEVDKLKEENQIKLPKSKDKKNDNDNLLRIHANKLDDLIQQIGELTIFHDVLLIGKNDEDKRLVEFSESIENCNKTIKKIQNMSLSLRMSPLKSLFVKLKRLAIELGFQQHKKIKVQLEGSDVELDKTVVERMSEALAHVVRNSVDHGIEPFEVREANGKFPQATITISAEHRVNGVIINVKDDGRGLNATGILKKAEDLKIAEKNKKYSDEDIYNFIFEPGFSTRKHITEISGRGVGLDVVKNIVSGLRGETSISSKEGIGTNFKFHLPSLLSIFKGMVIRISDEFYVFPTKDILEIFPLDSTKLRNVQNGDYLYSYRDDAIPLFNLINFFANAKEQKEMSLDGKIGIVTIINGRTRLLIVDEVKYQRNIVYKELGREVKKLPGIYGSAILETGEVVLIMDVPSLEKHMA